MKAWLDITQTTITWRFGRRVTSAYESTAREMWGLGMQHPHKNYTLEEKLGLVQILLIMQKLSMTRVLLAQTFIIPKIQAVIFLKIAAPKNCELTTQAMLGLELRRIATRYPLLTRKAQRFSLV